MRQVVALYVDPMGPYPSLLGLENCWDEARNAKDYNGPDPVVAHPPCGPWGRLSHFCTKQDPECGLHAIAQVQAFGGVLEHPADSRLWRTYKLPKPEVAHDEHGGFTLRVNQVNWGHSCVKPTWLYVVGVSKSEIEREILTGRTATKRVTNGHNGVQLPRCSKKERIHSPLAFSKWLISIAGRCHK